MNDRRYSPEKIKSSPSVLLVEDNDDDVFLMKRAFGKLDLPFSIHFVQDGQEAIDFLSQNDKTRFPLPQWIVSDIKMPRISGIEFVRWIRGSEFHHIPIIILSSSGQKQDIRDAYKAGVCGYFVKPGHFEELVDVWKIISSYWSKAAHP